MKENMNKVYAVTHLDQYGSPVSDRTALCVVGMYSSLQKAKDAVLKWMMVGNIFKPEDITFREDEVYDIIKCETIDEDGAFAEISAHFIDNDV